MPVSEQTPVNSYTGNGVTTVFAYTFKIIAAADIEVTVDGVVKTLTTDYSVSGVGADGGGNVTFISAPANGTTVVIQRAMAYERATDYQENGDLPAQTLDDDLDRGVMLLQQLKATLTRSIKLPAGETTEQVIAESAAARALKLLGFDAGGDVTVYGAADVDLATVSAYMLTLLDDATAADARATLGAWGGASADIASAATLDLTAATGNIVRITGTTATSAVTLNNGQYVICYAAGAWPLTYHATNNPVPGGADFTCAAGDLVIYSKNNSGEISVQIVPKDGRSVVGGAKVQDFRLSLTSGLPVTTSNVTAATTIYAVPLTGNSISLYNTSISAWVNRSASEFSLAIGTLTSGKPYDVFCYDNSGTPTLELLAWTNDTTRATALAYQDGILVKSGAASRRYLGTFYTTSTTTTEDSETKRFLYNYYHRKRRHLVKTDSTASWTYTTASYRQANNAAANQVEAIQGVAEDAVFIDARLTTSMTAAGFSSCPTGIGIDSTSASSHTRLSTNNAAYTAAGGWSIAEYRGIPSAGYHKYVWLETGASNTTIYGGSAGNGISGEVMA